jgi:hypothetical protein
MERPTRRQVIAAIASAGLAGCADPSATTTPAKTTTGTGPGTATPTSTDDADTATEEPSPTPDGPPDADYPVVLTSERSGDETFGYRTAVHDDTLVVGAAGAPDEDGNKVGAVDVFTVGEEGWHRSTTLRPAVSTKGPFGFEVALGDGVLFTQTVAEVDSDLAYAVDVFERSDGQWNRQTVLTPPNPNGSNLFGASIAVSGTTAVVGAPRDDPHGQWSGSVHVFERDGADWTRAGKLVAPDGERGDRFGHTVDTDGTHIAVGASTETASDKMDGTCFVYRRTEDGWKLSASIVADERDHPTTFGRSVALDDGSLAVGASPYNFGDEGMGLVTTYDLDGDQVQSTGRVTPPDGQSYEFFGFSVGLDDGTVLVGGPEGNSRDQDGLDAAAFVYDRVDSAWTTSATLRETRTDSGRYFGIVVALDDGLAAVSSWPDDERDLPGAVTLFEV